ncbi:HDOD domain-containing protein [Campylobacter sp.]|uniref:HDOD domain-containing protein n=1 Tax=Campylobacter sp. TaxID=205 RepID=UPI002707B633|nr:HDOD domain-containing protein [Campylobacter sp.]
MIEEFKKRIKTLPPLPKSFQKISEICDGDGSVGELSKAIESDPMMVADMLKTANSPLYGFNRQIKTVLQAVSLFGKSMTKALIMNSTVQGMLKVSVEPYGVSPEQFVNISNLQGAIAKAWFKRVAPDRADDLFLCALLQDTGKILISDEVIKRDEVMYFKDDIAMNFDIGAVEMNNFNTTSILVAADIFDHWRFEANMVENIRHSNDPKNAPDEFKQMAWALYIIRILANQKQQLSELNVQTALNLAAQNGFDEQILKEVIKEIKDRNLQ